MSKIDNNINKRTAIQMYDSEKYDLQSEKETMQAVVSAFEVEDTTIAQQIILLSRIFNNRYADLAGLSKTHFEGYNAKVFQAIVDCTKGNNDEDLDIVSFMALLDKETSSYTITEIIQNQELKKFNVWDSHDEIKRGSFNQLKGLLYSAAEKKRRFWAAMQMLNADEPADAARFASVAAHYDTYQKVEVFTASQEFAKRKFLFAFNGGTLFPEGNFYTLMGAQKSGKSHIFAVWLSAVLYGECCGFSYIGNERPSILYIDTEQDMVDAQAIVHTANILAHKPIKEHRSNLHCATVSQCSRTSVIGAIAEHIELCKPSVVFIDGFGGLVQDVNDTKVCVDVVNELRILAQQKGITIFGIVHTTPTAQTVKALGVFGSELQRWGGGTMLNERKEGYYKLTAFELRKGGNIEPFNYKLMTSIISNGTASDPFPYSDLSDKLKELGKGYNDVDILAIPTPISAEEAERYDNAKESEEMDKRRKRNDDKAYQELTAKFCAIYNGDEVKAYDMTDLKAKYADRFGGGENRNSDLVSAKRKIIKASELGVLVFDEAVNKYRYVKPKVTNDNE